MSQKQELVSDTNVLYQLAGITGLGWTVLILGYVSTVIGYGHSHIPESRSLLYLAGVLFVVTFGLERVGKGLPNED